MTAPKSSRHRTAHLARYRCWRGTLLALALLAAAETASAADQVAPPPEQAVTQDAAAPPEPAAPLATPWLNEVRAQRHAWEERRKAVREDFEARRRINDPWGAAQKEAWADEVERRRDARRQHLDQERERFRDLGPSHPPTVWPDLTDPQNPFTGPPGQFSTPSTEAKGDGTRAPVGEPPVGGIVYPPGAPPTAPYSPQDWDNLWYYRGY
jgi:hypothetical protein